MIEPTAGSTGGLSGAAAGPTSRSVLGKDQFLKLLVAQMQNQDPMNPMDGRQMAVQLAQFSSVEQLIQLNEQLGSQARSQEAMTRALHGSMATHMLGRRVLAEGDRAVVTASGDDAVTVEVPPGGGEATLELFDSAGRRVGVRDLGFLEGGRQRIELGRAADGLEPGAYRYSVSLPEGSGQVRTFVSGVVDGVEFGPDGTVLKIGPAELPFTSVVEVTPAD